MAKGKYYCMLSHSATLVRLRSGDGDDDYYTLKYPVTMRDSQLQRSFRF